MKTTLGEVRRLIRETLLTELKLMGSAEAAQAKIYRVYQLNTNFIDKDSSAHGNFIVVPYDMPMYGQTDKGYVTSDGGVQGYLKVLGLNKDSKDQTQPHYYVSESESFVINHENQTINLDVAKRSKSMSRRGGKTNAKGAGSRSYTIPHADTAFDNIHELQKMIKAIMAIDHRLTDDYKIKGSPNFDEVTVGEALKKERPGDQIVKGGQAKPMVFYHGTSEKRLVGIKAKGLNPGNAPLIYVDLVDDYSKFNIYLSTTVTQAENYATRAAVDDGGKAVVLKVIVHDPTKIIMDEDNTNWLDVTNPKGEETSIHFKHNNWRSWPSAPQIMQKYMMKLASSANKTGAVAYRGRIPPSDVSVFSTYKPSSMKKEPDWTEYANAREKTMDTYTKGEPNKRPRKATEPSVSKLSRDERSTFAERTQTARLLGSH